MPILTPCPTPFRITVDPSRNFLHIVMSGFWTVADARRMGEEHERAVASIDPTNSGFLMLIDQRDMQVQSPEVMAQLGIVATKGHKHPAKTAIVASSALVRMQGKRLETAVPLNWFETDEEAMAWLFPDGQ